MCKQIKIVISVCFVVGSLAFASSTNAQSLRRPVDSVTTPEISLAELAQKLNPGRDMSSAGPRVYTNAELKLRPAPVAPTTPAFPEVAEPRGILEHPGVPEKVDPQFETVPSGPPLWDAPPGSFLVPFPFDGRHRRGRVIKPGEDLHDRFGIFTSGFGLRSTGLSPPFNLDGSPRRDLFKVKPQGSSKGGPGKGGPGNGSGKGGKN